MATLASAVIHLQDAPRPVVAFARDFRDGDRLETHSHPRAQLVHSIAGVMAVTTPDGTWIVPPRRALWVPPFVEHGITMQGQVSMRTLYVTPEAARGMPQRVRAITVTPLLRELILRALEFPSVWPEQGPAALIMRLALEEIRAAPAEPLSLPMPSHPGLQAFARAALDDPADRRDLPAWAASLGIGARTLARRFRTETGMSPGAWRQQARLLAAFSALAAGRSVTTVSFDLGYETPSAFIEAFRRAFGTTPGRYFGS
jgi:AraC-like DNA-binding protein